MATFTKRSAQINKALYIYPTNGAICNPKDYPHDPKDNYVPPVPPTDEELAAIAEQKRIQERVIILYFFVAIIAVLYLISPFLAMFVVGFIIVDQGIRYLAALK